MLIKIGEDRTETFFINKHVFLLNFSKFNKKKYPFIQLLCSFSKYFDNLFFGDWSDNKKTQYCFEINEIEDFDALAFGFMIYSVMTMGGIVAESNFMTNCHCELNEEIHKLNLLIYQIPFLSNY